MIVHLIHYPVSAKRFVEPLVSGLIEAGYNAQLWFEGRGGLENFSDTITVPKRSVEFDLTFNPINCLKRIINLCKIFKDEKPIAIHAHQSRSSFIPLLAAKIAGIKTRIYHNHGLPYLGYKGPQKWAFWFLEFINSALATHVLAISPPLLNQMRKSKIVSVSKSDCLGKGTICGIDLNEFTIEKFNAQSRKSAREKIDISEDAFVVLYVGRPFARKGYHDLLNAWQMFTAENPEAELVLVTAGCEFSDAAEVQNAPLPGLISIGYVTDLTDYYAAADVVTLPSWHEGVPYSLLEAAAAQRAIIATDIIGMEVIVDNGNTGLLVPAKKPSELSACLTRCYKDSGLRSRLAQNARKMIEKNFDRNISKRLLVGYYIRVGI